MIDSIEIDGQVFRTGDLVEGMAKCANPFISKGRIAKICAEEGITLEHGTILYKVGLQRWKEPE